jgi:hypothetical protein
VNHSGADPGFGSRVVLLPELRTGVVVLANSNTVPTTAVATAALDVALANVALPGTAGSPELSGEGVAALLEVLPSVAQPVAETLAASGPEAARAAYHRLTEEEPAGFDPDDEGFVDAVWGAIELHRTDLVWPLLRLWTELRPESSEAWTMTGWAHQVDGDPDLARRHLERALELDPGNDEAAQILAALPSA